ncbi:alpha/beta fold hydrolase [Kosakonia cowanii]|uniref:alpha/beta fold hydrolase n=1 Tax=Kosakonia cowanii TaxID=208223 RepID=UPI00345BEB69
MRAPVLLVHGLFGSLSSPGILAPFGKQCIYAPDLIGYGQCQKQGENGWTLNHQADHLAGFIHACKCGPVHLAGHSVGGAVAVLMAVRHPDLVSSLTLIEGNLTLSDAFWSQKISKQSLEEIQTEVSVFRADVAAWIAGAGVTPTDFAIETATAWLDNQPVSTIRTQAQAVVAATGEESYLEGLRHILSSLMPVHLISGERSQTGWHVPAWLKECATTYTVIPETGHLMMIEQPDVFARSVLNNLSD